VHERLAWRSGDYVPVTALITGTCDDADLVGRVLDRARRSASAYPYSAVLWSDLVSAWGKSDEKNNATPQGRRVSD
jgi:hypothetical protein